MNSPESPLLSHKITTAHLQRTACVYIRQSSMRQVECHRESQVNQRQMITRAVSLGWHESRINVIDADLGLSGATTTARGGFKELVAEVSLNHVGIILGYEVSRLARNNADWYHLLDLAAVFSTLIADWDGIYDPRLYNDRLLLGLKGTMSEAELHLLRLRLNAGRLSQVRRGEYRQKLPTGLVRLPDASVVKDPDAQVRSTLEIIFAKFIELGSCRRVLRYLHQQAILVPRRHHSGARVAGELHWKPPSDSMLHEMLKNPAYAGAFAYGRRALDAPSHSTPPTASRPRQAQEQWSHLQQGVYPAYITWEQFIKNQQHLRQNATRFAHAAARHSPGAATGAARHGLALLQGLVVCARCGYHMTVMYKAQPRYQCAGLTRRFGQAMCVSLGAPAVDQAVVDAFFAALRPAQLDALSEVLAAQAVERQRLVRHWEQSRQRVRYSVHLAAKQYHAVDPDNRLVAAELESRWEAALREQRETEEAYERFQHDVSAPTLTPELRAQLQHICETLPGLWAAGRLSVVQRKELLRALIGRVILKRTAADTIEAKIVWISGHHTLVSVTAPILRTCDMSGYAAMEHRIEELWRASVVNDEAVADQLTAEGFHSARLRRVSPKTVQKIRFKHGWYDVAHQVRSGQPIAGYMTISGVAARLGVERTWVHKRLHNKTISPEYVHRSAHSRVWLIRDAPELIVQLEALLPDNLRTRERQING